MWLSIEQSWIPFTKECFLSSLAENGPLVLENTILKYLQCFFLVILLLCPLEKYVVHHFNKHKSLSPKNALCQVWLKLSLVQWFCWKRFFNVVNVLLLLCSLPLEWTWIPFTQGCFVPGLIEILEKIIFLNDVNYIDEFLLICCYLPIKRVWPFICTNLNPFTQGCLMPSLVEICWVVQKKRMKLWKVYRLKDRQTV